MRSSSCTQGGGQVKGGVRVSGTQGAFHNNNVTPANLPGGRDEERRPSTVLKPLRPLPSLGVVAHTLPMTEPGPCCSYPYSWLHAWLCRHNRQSRSAGGRAHLDQPAGGGDRLCKAAGDLQAQAALRVALLATAAAAGAGAVAADVPAVAKRVVGLLPAYCRRICCYVDEAATSATRTWTCLHTAPVCAGCRMRTSHTAWHNSKLHSSKRCWQVVSLCVCSPILLLTPAAATQAPPPSPRLLTSRPPDAGLRQGNLPFPGIVLPCLHDLILGHVWLLFAAAGADQCVSGELVLGSESCIRTQIWPGCSLRETDHTLGNSTKKSFWEI